MTRAGLRELLASLPAASQLVAGFASLDVDGDADRDLVVSRIGGCFVTCSGAAADLWLNDGSGQLSAAGGQLPPNDDHPTGVVAAADVDGDGDADLVLGGVEHCWIDTLGNEECTVSGDLVWLNDGAGNFAELPGALTSGNGVLERLVLADLSGDGAAEAFTSNDLGTVLLYQNDGGGLFSPNFPATGAHPGAVQMASPADLNLDGALDLVVTYEVQGSAEDARLMLNDGAGNLVWDASELVGFGAHLHAALDLEHDGDTDLVLAGHYDARIHRNDGSGAFADLGPLEGYAGAGFAAWGDVDLDGDDDLMLDNQLYLGDGSGALGRVTDTLPWPRFASARAVELIDLDGDGDLDAVVGNEGYAYNDAYLNDGAGHLVAGDPGDWLAAGAGTAMLAVDLDGDGRDELAATYAYPYAPARVYSVGGGTLTSIAILPDSARAPRSPPATWTWTATWTWWSGARRTGSTWATGWAASPTPRACWWPAPWRPRRCCWRTWTATGTRTWCWAAAPRTACSSTPAAASSTARCCCPRTRLRPPPTPRPTWTRTATWT